MEIEKFKDFINNQTLNKKEWLNGINLLYTGNSQTNVRETKRKINKIIKSNGNEELALWDFRNYNHWIDCVKKDVIQHKENYLKALLL